MTKCNEQSLLFSSVGRKKIVADFAGGNITSDGGLPLLREVDRRIGLIDALNDAIHDPRHPLLLVHQQRTLLAQRILGLAAGYEDLNDHTALRQDPLLQALTDRPFQSGRKDDGPLGSASTLCRLENRVTRKDLARVAEVLVRVFIASFASPPEQLILDFDATDNPIHGKQDLRFFHGYYDQYCFLPLYVFCGEQLLVSYLRPSNIDASLHSRAILKLLVRALRKAWPDVKIIFRADSGFCRWRLMRWCDRNGVDYVIGLAKNPVLKRLARRSMVTARWQYRQTKLKQRIFEEFEYAAQSWDRPRRVIAKAEYTEQGENPRFVVTSLVQTPQDLYDAVYCQRGEAENRIKEQQLGMFASRTSCQEFLANQFRMMLSSAGYVLMETLRRVGLPQTELANAQATTIRLKLLKIGGRVVQSVRRLVVHLASSFPLAHVLRTALANILAWQPQPLIPQGVPSPSP